MCRGIGCHVIVTTSDRVEPPAGVVVHVLGEVDTFSADRLGEHLAEAGTGAGGAVVVDLSGVTFMGCAALSVLAEAQRRLGSRFFLDGTSRIVTRLLELTGFSSRFPAPTADDPGTHGTGDAPAGGPQQAGDAGPRAWVFSRTDVERARGLLMATHGCDADRAWSMLARASARHGVAVGELVELLIRPSRDPGRRPSAAAATALLAVTMREPAGDLAGI